MPVAHGHPRVGARYMWTGQDGAVGPLLRMGLEPRRLASGAVLGVVIGLISLLPLASEEGPKAVGYVGVALMVVLTALRGSSRSSTCAPSADKPHATSIRPGSASRADTNRGQTATLAADARRRSLRRRPSEVRRAARPFLANAVVLLPRCNSAATHPPAVAVAPAGTAQSERRASVCDALVGGRLPQGRCRRPGTA